jgi:hypothetical protein
LTAPIVEVVARATSSILISFTLSMVTTVRWRSDSGATKSSKESGFEAFRFVERSGKTAIAVSRDAIRRRWR